MEESFELTIEKIKLMEQDQEAKLKQKREYELSISSLNKAIKDTSTAIEKCIQEYTVLIKKLNAIRNELFIEKIRRDALVSTLTTFVEELNNLKKQSHDGVHAVWNLRSDLCATIQDAVDECDIRALLVKPKYSDMGNSVPKPHCARSSVIIDEGRLKLAFERRDKAIAERTRLILEPDNGKEFIRNSLILNKSRRFLSSKVQTEVNENEPIKFSTSPAAQRMLGLTPRRTNISIPWYQPYSVVISITVFLLYFCVFREENDVDLEFNKTLYDRIKGLEKEQLLQTYRYNKEHGKSIEDVERRLLEIEAEEARQLA